MTILVSGGGDGLVWFWDPLTGEPAGDPIVVHDPDLQPYVEVYAVTAVRSTLLATGGEGGILQVWDPATRRPAMNPVITGGGVVLEILVVPLPDGRQALVTSSMDAKVRLFDAATGRPIRQGLRRLTLKQDADVETIATVGLAGQTAVAVAREGGHVQLWDPGTGRSIGNALATGRPAALNSMVAFSLSYGREALAIGTGDSTVELWDPGATTVSRTLTGQPDKVNAVAVVERTDGWPLIAAAGVGPTIHVWNPSTGEPDGEPIDAADLGGINALTTIALPDGRRLLAAGGSDHTVRMWDVATHRPFGQPLTGHTDQVFALATLPTSTVDGSGPA